MTNSTNPQAAQLDHAQLASRLHASELASRLDAHQVRVTDVREQVEFASGHIAGSQNVPLARLGQSPLPKGPLVLVCQSGRRSARGLDQLRAAGHPFPISDLEGGLPSWEQAGLPLQRHRNAPMPLMRQVQIAAGSLVLLGLGLGTWVAPAWMLLSAFVGAGLVFAGVSGFCGMALLLARAPWNRIRS